MFAASRRSGHFMAGSAAKKPWETIISYAGLDRRPGFRFAQTPRTQGHDATFSTEQSRFRSNSPQF
jgi:hypothetical protein